MEQKENKDNFEKNLVNEEDTQIKDDEDDISSIVPLIEEDLKENFPSDRKDCYIYTKFNKKKKLFKIFVKFYAQTKLNKKGFSIQFLITLLKRYPERPPYVQCLSNFIFPTLFDCRNLITSIYPRWGKDTKISQVINEIPNFLNVINFDIQNKIFPDYGDFQSANTLYSINTFLHNPLIFFRKILFEQPDTKKKKIYLSRYLIITDSNFLILETVDKNDLSVCIIFFCDEIKNAEEIKFTDRENTKILVNKGNIEIKWKKGECMKFIANKEDCSVIVNEMEKKKKTILSTFKYFCFDRNINTIESIENIISIKEKFFDTYGYNDYNFFTINRLYSQIIDLLIKNNLLDINLYVNKMTEFNKRFEEKQKIFNK